MTLYKNKDTGEMLTYKEMLREGAELYDLGDPCSCLDYAEYYEEISD